MQASQLSQSLSLPQAVRLSYPYLSLFSVSTAGCFDNSLHTPLDHTAPKLYLHINSTIATEFLLHTGPTTKDVHSLVVANFIPPLRFVFVQT